MKAESGNLLLQVDGLTCAMYPRPGNFRVPALLRAECGRHVTCHLMCTLALRQSIDHAALHLLLRSSSIGSLRLQAPGALASVDDCLHSSSEDGARAQRN